jgi:hypothetical protein
MLNRAEFIATQADDQTQRVGDPVTAMLLVLEALPDAVAARLSQRMMPREASAQNVLDWAWRDDTLRPWHERKPFICLSHYHRVDVGGAWTRVFDRPTRSATLPGRSRRSLLSEQQIDHSR